MALALACALLLAASPASAGSGGGAEDGLGRHAGLGAGAALTTLIYSPLKLVYAITGSVVGGLAWMFSAGDSDVSRPIFDSSIRGTYVITPDHLTGDKDIDFFGRRQRSHYSGVAAGPDY